MKLEIDKEFLAISYDGHPLLCEVWEIKNNVAYCKVINGAWDIGFNTDTLEMCDEGTAPQVRRQPSFGARVVMTDLPTGSKRGDYNVRIAAALKVLNGEKT